jgi:hypothetical protein
MGCHLITTSSRAYSIAGECPLALAFTRNDDQGADLKVYKM